MVTVVFNRFSFSLFHRVRSQKFKPDYLSRLIDPEPVAKEPSAILPLTWVIGTVSWQIENEVKQANSEASSPSGCPENRLDVPANLRIKVIHWAYSSLLTCHPGVRRTMFAISWRFWWPSMEPEVREYIAACLVCARKKISTQPRMGLLQPLPISLQTVGQHHNGLRHGASGFPRQHHSPHCGRQVLQDDQIHRLT